jgi:hypothetical protein
MPLVFTVLTIVKLISDTAGQSFQPAFIMGHVCSTDCAQISAVSTFPKSIAPGLTQYLPALNGEVKTGQGSIAWRIALKKVVKAIVLRTAPMLWSSTNLIRVLRFENLAGLGSFSSVFFG